MSECNHCWHDAMTTLTSDPPQHQLICCECGGTRNVKSVPAVMIDGGTHGKFAATLPISQRNRGIQMDFPEKAPTPQPEITPELVAEFQKRQQAAEQQRISEAAQKIAELARSLDVEIVGVAQLVALGNGVQGIAPSWGVQGIQR